RPVLTAISRYLNEAIVGACPDQIFLHRRLCKGEHCVIVFDASDVKRDRPARGLLLTLVIACEIRTDCRPTRAVIGALKDHFSGRVEHVGIVWRKQDRLSPLKTMLQFAGSASRSVERPRRNALRLLGTLVKAGDHSPAIAGIDDVGITRIRRDIPGLAATD